MQIEFDDIFNFLPKNQANYEFRISEGAYDNVKIGEILASDGDVGANAEIEFEIPKSEQKIPDLVKIDGKGILTCFIIFKIILCFDECFFYYLF